jgi:hypothetical protein
MKKLSIFPTKNGQCSIERHGNKAGYHSTTENSHPKRMPSQKAE